jgi:hypothetical protein
LSFLGNAAGKKAGKVMPLSLGFGRPRKRGGTDKYTANAT